MTYLKLNQLIVTKRGKIVYNEPFPHKINIIRGENGSGKSTIANFIYFALGGDYIEWLPEAKVCDFVFAQVTINGKIFTLKREIIDKIMQPMQIFYGPIEEAIKSAMEGWRIYPYRKSEQKESFSQLLFNQLNFPEVTTENNESITLNQILRLLYIDQMSPLNTLIKNVDFDSPLIRQAIGYLLMGIYDDRLFNEQIDLRNKKRNHTELNKEYQAVKEVYKNSNFPIDINTIDQQIKEKEESLNKINDTLANRELIVEDTQKNEVFKKISELKSAVNKTSEEISTAISTINKIERDTIDSQDFIDELIRQDQALDESLAVRETFGKLDVSFCPSCLNPVSALPDGEEKCQLCKEPINLNDHKFRILKIKQEIQSQIRESKYLLTKKNTTKDSLSDQIKTLKRKLNLEYENLNSYLANTNSKVDRKQDELLIRKGEITTEIANAINQKKMIQSFLNLKSNVDRLEKEISTLEETVKNKEEAQRKKTATVLNRIQHYSLILLKGDGNIERGFETASRIGIDFSKNLYFVDERNNFSASSLVILKNSIRFGIFFASLELDFMRYPRFILCDNMEDKGMREERSHNFQKNVVKLAESIDKDFQIIFTTSMIDENLENSNYTIGGHYNPDSKSLIID